MFIKYTGDKPSKKLEWQHKDWGKQEYVFNPICKVTDPEFAKFLLHPDRKNLFVMVDEKDLGEITPSEPVKAQPVKVPQPELDKKAKSKKEKAEAASAESEAPAEASSAVKAEEQEPTPAAAVKAKGKKTSKAKPSEPVKA